MNIQKKEVRFPKNTNLLVKICDELIEGGFKY